MIAPVDDDVWSFLKTRSTVHFLASVGTQHDALARVGMSPIFQALDEVVSHCFVFGSRFDHSIWLPTTQVDPQHRIVRVFVEIRLCVCPVDDAVANLRLDTSEPAAGSR